MLKPKLILPLFFVIPLLLIMMLISLNLPDQTQASPLAGITVTNTPSRGGGGGGDDDEDPTPPPPGQPPKNYVWVKVDQCDLTCGGGSAEADDGPASVPQYQLLVAANSNLPLPLLLEPAAQAPEMLVSARLIHQGSGFIADTTLSTQHDTRVLVPYPGHWDVFLTALPQFNTAETIDTSATNLAQLQASLATNPVALGLVEANTAEPQLVRCPVECVIIPAAPEPAPPFLPQTGAAKSETPADISPLSTLIVGALSMASLSLMAYIILRLKAARLQPLPRHVVKSERR